MDNFDMDGEVTETPMSRTHQYRKVMKPMLERKRRARINKCLDDLKDLMVHALQTEGESISKLEKADVLELTVRHLRKLRRQEMLTLNPHSEQESYRAGYSACASEISRCLGSVVSVDLNTRTRLMSHLAHSLSPAPPVRLPLPSLPLHPVKVKVAVSPPGQEQDLGYNSGRDSTPSPSPSQETVWRPF